MTSDTPTPDLRSLIAGHRTAADEIRLRDKNQAAAENAGHVQSVPMTAAGLSQLRLLRDALSREMSEKGIPPSLRDQILSATPELTLQGQQTRLEVAAARPLIQELRVAREQAQARPSGG